MIKKNLFSLYGTIVLTMVLATGDATGQQKPQDDPCQGSTKTDGCPSVWVDVTPAFFSQSPADHTYVKFLKKNGKWQSFPCFGACNGGKELSDTKSSTWEDNKKIIQYMANAAPCKWPDEAYLAIGVCHQLANRSLFHTGKIVKYARMYKWSSFVYQTYGYNSPDFRKYWMSNCQEASSKIGTWQPGSPPTCLPPGVKKASPVKPDAEYQIYMEHFSDLKVTESVQVMSKQMKFYRNKLLTLHIDQRLGNKYMRDYLPMLSEGQDELLQRKEVLDRRLLEYRSLREDIIDAYNKLFNASLARFQAQMPRDLYEQFFGLAYDAKIDVRMFLPRE
jgi:hypothetical protein